MRLAVAMLVLAACHPSPRPRPAPTAYERIEARLPGFVAMMTGLGKELEAIDNCRDVAARLRRFGLEHADELPELEELRARLSPAERERFAWEHDDEERELAKAFHTVASACSDNAEVGAARAIAGFR
ncbi:MAG: hypothetical protein KF773_34895 [Deltaproteobacteria bacterium]|nr:hypothetical protein [Deltaproteobacteria bacterium]